MFNLQPTFCAGRLPPVDIVHLQTQLALAFVTGLMFMIAFQRWPNGIQGSGAKHTQIFDTLMGFPTLPHIDPNLGTHEFNAGTIDVVKAMLVEGFVYGKDPKIGKKWEHILS